MWISFRANQLEDISDDVISPFDRNYLIMEKTLDGSDYCFLASLFLPILSDRGGMEEERHIYATLLHWH
jgi:hypothetical protein